MSNAANHHKINYIEFQTTNVARSKQFYSTVFGWTFVDYGPEYAAFTAPQSGIDGGFMLSEQHEIAGKFAPLIVLYSSDLKSTEDAVIAAGGAIEIPTFEFPGGRRFHFSDGAGNTLAVWSE